MSFIQALGSRLLSMLTGMAHTDKLQTGARFFHSFNDLSTLSSVRARRAMPVSIAPYI